MIGKVNADMTVKVFSSKDLGTDVGGCSLVCGKGGG